METSRTTRIETKPLTGWEFISVVAVSLYLLCVAVWLMITRQLPSASLLRILKATFYLRYAGPLPSPKPEEGNCWVVSVPDHLLSDRESVSMLRVFENGLELGPAHSTHDEIRRLGSGRFSHWNAQLFFSTSDNSDPRANGRRYEIREVRW